jgi:hypothetical protein
MSLINERTSARNSISDEEPVSPRRCDDPQLAGETPIRAELSGGRRCSAVGIVVNAYAPVLTLARQLIRGFPPDRILEVYRGATLCFRVPLATASRLEVRDSNHGRPVFVPWRSRSTRTAPPIAPNDLASTPLAEPLQKTPSASDPVARTLSKIADAITEGVS